MAGSARARNIERQAADCTVQEEERGDARLSKPLDGPPNRLTR